MSHFNVSYEDLAILTPYSAQREEVRYQQNEEQKRFDNQIMPSKETINKIRRKVHHKNSEIERTKRQSIAANRKKNKIKKIKKEIERLEESIYQEEAKISKDEQKLMTLQQLEKIQVKTITESQGIYHVIL